MIVRIDKRTKASGYPSVGCGSYVNLKFECKKCNYLERLYILSTAPYFRWYLIHIFMKARFDYIDTGCYSCKSLDPDHRRINNNYLNNDIVLTRDGAGGGGGRGGKRPLTFQTGGATLSFCPQNFS